MNTMKHAGGIGWRARLQLFLYWLVRVDPEVMTGCPVIDRFHMQAKAALLLAVASIAVFAWGAFLLLFWPWYIALPLLCPIIVWMVLLDQAMGSANWKLQGILRRPGSRQALLGWAVILGLVASNATLGLRLGIAGVTSSATAYSATMAMSHETIAAQEEKDRNEANAALRANGEAEKQQRWRDMLGADDAAVKEAAAALEKLQQQIADARKNRESAASTVADAQVSADCEMHGGRGSGCKRGRGPKYRAALFRSAAANAAMGRSAADLAALEGQLPDAESKYQDALKTFRAREADYLTAAQAIDERVARDAVPPRNDPVMAYRALQKIYQSPDGAGTQFYSHLMLMLLLTVELSYVLVSEYFGHASVYMVRLMARTRVLAAEVAEDTRRKIAALFGKDDGDDPDDDPPGGVAYRVLPRFGDDD
jgi:Domain of unknown function (DUF4407)